jgi:opacity protein-like surface antigen
MDRRTWVCFIAAALASICTSGASAADRGFYVSVAAGQAEEDPESNGINIGFGFPPFDTVHIEPQRVDVDASGVAWGVAVGYRLNRYVAAELEYMDFATTNVSEHYELGPDTGIPFILDYSSKVTGPALSVLGTVPLGSQFDGFLRAGVLFADRQVEISNSVGLGEPSFGSTVWLAGVGVDWSLTDRWAMRAEYQRTGTLGKSLLAGETELERMALSLLFRL